jgi:hypothetical protein
MDCSLLFEVVLFGGQQLQQVVNVVEFPVDAFQLL